MIDVMFRWRRIIYVAELLLILHLVTVGRCHAQLRIVTYNTATGNPAPGVQTVRDGTDIVLRSIGEELNNDIAKPIDVVLLQEQFSNAVSTQSVVDLMNGIYGTAQNPMPYARGMMDAITSDSEGRGGGPAVVYKTQAVSLVEEIRFGIVNGSNQPRSTLRYRFRPAGYTESADFYVYNSHYKASDASADRARRQVEASSIRNHPTFGSDALSEGAHIIYAGDHNFYRSTELAFQTLISTGNGQAFDPVNRIGTWTNNAQFADVHTQSPCISGCGATSGIDDRFDFQLVSGELFDGEGLSYIGGSYHAFGNNGSTFNDDINDSSNTYVFSGVTSHTKAQILNALHRVTDHIPVVADYQLPAIMQAVAGIVPATLMMGQAFNLNVTVSNAANVVAAIGADELDYSLTASGDLTGTFLNQVDAALTTCYGETPSTRTSPMAPGPMEMGTD